MGAKVSYETKRLVSYGRGIKRAITDGLEQGGNSIHDLAAQLAPKDTEALSQSGQVTMNGMKVEVSFGNGLEDARAVAQEYGTVFMPPQPYLTPALRAINVAQYIADNLNKL